MNQGIIKRLELICLLLAIAGLIIGMAGCSSLLDIATTSPIPVQTTPAVSDAPTPSQLSLDRIAAGSLPPEARTTLHLIKSGGPFPFAKDGAVFSNFEKLLPQKPSGYYHEYTVVTPGSSDRGARRIVAGANGEYYYTDDHYGSFRIIVE